MTQRVLLLIMVIAAGSLVTIADNYKSTQKQKVIAGAIYKFIKFVDWETPLLENNSVFTLCLQQYDSAFEPMKTRQVKGKTIEIAIVDLLNGGQSRNSVCDVFYLNTAQNNHLEILQELKNKSVLTISEQSGFVEAGGVIELGNVNNRLTFSINTQAAKANHLNIGFQLLSLARKVIGS